MVQQVCAPVKNEAKRDHPRRIDLFEAACVRWDTHARREGFGDDRLGATVLPFD